MLLAGVTTKAQRKVASLQTELSKTKQELKQARRELSARVKAVESGSDDECAECETLGRKVRSLQTKLSAAEAARATRGSRQLYTGTAAGAGNSNGKSGLLGNASMIGELKEFQAAGFTGIAEILRAAVPSTSTMGGNQDAATVSPPTLPVETKLSIAQFAAVAQIFNGNK